MKGPAMAAEDARASTHSGRFGGQSLLTGLFAAALVAFAGSACNDGERAGCSNNTDCPQGHVCLTGQCEQLCEIDGDCSRGRYCNGEICVEGARGTPVIEGITGSGSDYCVSDTENPCIGKAIIVTGQNLGGCQFHLEGTSGDIALVPPVGGRIQSDLVELAPAEGDLEAGEFLLVAANAAGKAEESLTLLQGEPGGEMTGEQIVASINSSTAVIDEDNLPATPITGTDIINAINESDTQGVIAAEHVAGGAGGGSGTEYVYDNSTALTGSAPVSGDRMVVQVLIPANTGAPTSVAIDHARLQQLCGDVNGCTLTLAAIGWHYMGTSPIPAPYAHAPCRFFLVPGGGASGGDSWAISSSCTQYYALWKNAGESWTDPPGFYIPYYSAQFGTDGEDHSGADRWAVLHDRACLITESAPASGSAMALEVDDSAGLYLVAGQKDWATRDYWPAAFDSYWPEDTDRACRLIIED